VIKIKKVIKHYIWLIWAAQNIKNIAIKNNNVGKKPLSLLSIVYDFFIEILKNIINLSKKIYS